MNTAPAGQTAGAPPAAPGAAPLGAVAVRTPATWVRRAALPAAWLLGLGILSAAAVVYVLAPAWSEGERAAALRLSTDEQAATLHQTEEQVRSLVARAEQLERAADVRGVLRPPSDLNSRLAEIAALAETHGLSVTQLASQPPTPRERFIAVPIRLTGSGSPDRALALLAALPGERRDLAVVGLTLARPQPGPGASADQGELALDLIWCAAVSDSTTPQKTAGPGAGTASADGAAGSR